MVQIQAYAVVHFPPSFKGKRAKILPVQVDASTTVGSLKTIVVDKHPSLEIKLLSLCENGKVVSDEDPLSTNGEFKTNPVNGQIFFHLKVRDVEVEARIQELIKTPDQLRIPLDDVKIRY
eukprot:m.24854 g.24854  ORF g.24854 m.24854 type:complete len:120 (+) comp5701_c0_seq2:262-621(+)